MVKAKPGSGGCSLKFEAVGIDALFSVLDAIAWIDQPNSKAVTQFAGIDPRTTGKVIKNCRTINIIDLLDDTISLRLAYPPKGSKEQKEAVLKEALLKLPLIIHMRQFLNLGESFSNAARKAATIS